MAVFSYWNGFTLHTHHNDGLGETSFTLEKGEEAAEKYSASRETVPTSFILLFIIFFYSVIH